MAEAREQINAKVTAATKALLLHYCQERHATQGDVVDAALVAFFHPKADEEVGVAQMDLLRTVIAQLQTIEAKQESLEQGVAALIPFLTTMVERLEKPPPETEPPPPPIAAYAQLYKEFRPEADDAEEETSAPEAVEMPEDVSTPSPPRWGWFLKRRTAP
jgi:hypothetical protein